LKTNNSLLRIREEKTPNALSRSYNLKKNLKNVKGALASNSDMGSLSNMNRTYIASSGSIKYGGAGTSLLGVNGTATSSNN